MLKNIEIIKVMILKKEEPKSEKYLPEQSPAYVSIGATLLLLLIAGFIKTFKNLSGFNNLNDTILGSTTP